MVLSDLYAVSGERRGAARFLHAGLAALLLCQCGPYHEGGGTGGSSSGASSAGSSGANTGGNGTGGDAGSAGSAVGGAAGAPTNPASDAVIGCEAATWPRAGLFFEAPPVSAASDRAEALLGRFTPDGISGDGKLVVGHTDDPPYRLGAPLVWSVEGGVAQPPLDDSYTYVTQASCDGSTLLVQSDTFAQSYRIEGEGPPVPALRGASPGLQLRTDPTLSTIVNGFGSQLEAGNVPLRWTTATGFELLYGLLGHTVYGVAPNGALLAADASALYRYDASLTAGVPVGMSPVDAGQGWRTFAASADGNAWAQSADLNLDSFLLWRGGEQPRSITCPTPCRIRDISGTGRVVLLDVQFVPNISTYSSWLWTRQLGLVDLTTLFERHGWDFQGRKLIASALSDDGRAFAGNFWAPPTIPIEEYPPFFYAVLPEAAYE